MVKTEVVKEFYDGKKKKKKKIKMYFVVFFNVVISKLVEMKNNSKYLIGYLDYFIRALDLILPKRSGYVKTFKDKNNKLKFFCVDDDKLCESFY